MLDIPPADLADAKEALHALLDVDLEVSAWQEISSALADLRVALDRGDSATVRAVSGQLERLGPRRVATTQGSSARTPAPEPVRDQVNLLVHDIHVQWPRPDPRVSRDA